MNERITTGAAALMASLSLLTGITRLWPAPTGRHRAKPVLLLPDQPFALPASPVRHAPLDEAVLEQFLDNGDVLANEFATCPAEGLRRFHAFYRNGIRKCWTCGQQAAGDAIAATTTRGNS